MTKTKSHNNSNTVCNKVDHSIVSGTGFFNGVSVKGDCIYAKLAFKTGANESDQHLFEFGSFHVDKHAMPAVDKLSLFHNEQDHDAAISVKFAILDLHPTLRNGHVWLNGLLCRIQAA